MLQLTQVNSSSHLHTYIFQITNQKKMQIEASHQSTGENVEPVAIVIRSPVFLNTKDLTSVMLYCLRHATVTNYHLPKVVTVQRKVMHFAKRPRPYRGRGDASAAAKKRRQECIICLQKFAPRNLITVLGCGHRFHHGLKPVPIGNCIQQIAPSAAQTYQGRSCARLGMTPPQPQRRTTSQEAKAWLGADS